MNLSVRPAQEEDAGSIIELLNPIIQSGLYTAMDKELSVDDQARFIREFPPRGVYNVAVCNDSQRVVGIQDVQPAFPVFLNAFKHVGNIGTFVSLDMHRSGVGRNLCEATFKQAKEQGFIKLTAMIRADNPMAVLFYQNQGFKIIGTAKKHAFVGGDYIDEVIAERFLGIPRS